MKYSGIGGQAVIEGVMMKNGDEYAVAVRKPDQEIEVSKQEYKGVFGSSKFVKLPFIRGTFNFIDSLVLGMKIIMYSSSFYDEEEPKDTKKDKKAKSEEKAQVNQSEMADDQETQKTQTKVTSSKLDADEQSEKKSDTGFMILTMSLSIIIAVGLFMVLPVVAANFLKPFVTSTFLMSLIEGIIRIVIFLIYIVAISAMKDIKRTYMYHGSEHKCINCIEHGLPLTVENVKNSSRFHKRCGTSFLLIVMIISVLVFMCVRVDTITMRIISRILLIPVVAGISYEFLRLAGRNDNWFINLLSKPGLCLQRLTTKEPDESMIEVAIASVEAVFDWKDYLKNNFPDTDLSAYETEDTVKTGFTDLTEPGSEDSEADSDSSAGYVSEGKEDKTGFTNLSEG